MTPEDGVNFGVADQEMVQVRTTGERALVFEQVLVRVHSDFHLEMHLDLEEGNAAGLKNGDLVEIITL
jgi:putative phosphotransacetylase